MRVSLLLPVASAAFVAANFIVIPDEQTVKLVAFNRNQAPIAPDDKPAVVEPEKPHHRDGKPCHEKEDEHGRHGLHPQFILRERYAESGFDNVPAFDTASVEGFGQANIFDGGAKIEPSAFFHFYRPTGGYHHRHGGPHGGPREGPDLGPHPRPHPGPLEGPRREPTRGPRGPPHGSPYEDPHRFSRRRPEEWPPKPPGDRPPRYRPSPREPRGPRDEPPSWPPRPPREPARKPPPPHWDLPRDPEEPDFPGDRRPPRWGPPSRPGEPRDEPRHEPPEFPKPPPPRWGPPRDYPDNPDSRHPPHWGPPRRPGEPGEPGEEPPHREPPPHWPPEPGPPDHPGKGPKHPPPHRGWKPHPPNETIWQLISKSEHTTKFAEIVSEHEELVAILNGTLANHTLFVPTNQAFEKFKKAPKDWKPPKDLVKKFLTYHISNDVYSAFKLLLGHTIPSALDGGDIGGAQRIRVALGPGGLAVNFYSRIVAADIFATNGVIHAVDSVLFPPPPVGRIIQFFPSEFSTFLLAVHLTNLTHEIPHEHTGGTLFAPPNDAFQKLGPKINAFLFSPWGRKYLKALLKYHVVVNETLYSDAYYHPGSKSDVKAKDIPKGHYHVDLPTLLEGKHLSIDISRFGGLITILINSQSSVKVQDIIAKDGVIQVVSNVLIPPKKPPTGDLGAQEAKAIDDLEDLENTMGMTLRQFRERFEGLLEDDGVTEKYGGEWQD